MAYSWTQPCCQDCWNYRNPGREAVALTPEYVEKETCVYCEAETYSGIYVRIDPETAPFPTREK